MSKLDMFIMRSKKTTLFLLSHIYAIFKYNGRDNKYKPN